VSGLRRQTVTHLVVVVLAVSLVVVAWLSFNPVSLRDRDADPAPLPDPTGFAPPRPTIPPDTPEPGAAFPIRPVGKVPADGLTVTGRGNAEVRYARFPGNPTRVQFSCPTCTNPTWLVDLSRPHPLGGGPLARPTTHDDVVDYITPGVRNSLLVKVEGKAAWTLVLTPFDALPVQSATVTRHDTTFVHVRTTRAMTLRCPPDAFVKTFTRPRGESEYAVHRVIYEDEKDTVVIRPPEDTDLVVLLVSCKGSWTLTID
jgi:hypothetical protein